MMAGAVSQGGPVTQLADVVDHCVKSRRAGTVPSNVYIGTQEAMYLTCWDTLNAWILARLTKRLGVNIPSFGSISWEYFKTSEGRTRCRPIFLPAQNFCKSFKIRYRPPPFPASLAPMEELNFSRVAIRFSKTLTKDILFVGLRDVFRRVGEVIQSHAELRLAFSVGFLIAKDRKIGFEFDSVALAPPEGGLQGSIPASMRGGRLPCSGRPSTSASARGGPEALSTGRSRLSTGRLSEGSDPLPGLDQLSVPSPKAGAGGEGEGARAQHVKRLPLERIQGVNSRPYTAGLAEGGRSFPPDLLLETRDEAAAEVLKQSYKRYILGLKEDAMREERLRKSVAERGAKLDQKEREKRASASRQRHELQQFLVGQIRDREKQKADFISSKHEMVATTLPVDHRAKPKFIKISRAELVQSLSTQVKRKEDDARAETQTRLEEEKKLLRYIEEEIKQQALERRHKKQLASTMLKATWDMSTKFTRCKEILQKKGGAAVIGYLDSTGLEQTIMTPTTSSQKFHHMSVGFDSRR